MLFSRSQLKESGNKTPSSRSNKLAFASRRRSQSEETKAPKSGENRSFCAASSSNSRTPGNNSSRSAQKKGLKTRSLTPSRNPNYSGICGGDRFIPVRSDSQFELSGFLMNQNNQNVSQLNGSRSEPNSPSKADFQRIMRGNLNSDIIVNSKSSGDLSDYRILAYRKDQAPKTTACLQGQNHRVLYSARVGACSSSVRKTANRHIPTSPERILDAPEILDDYYLNLLDWSRENIVAVALSGSVYLWNAGSGDIRQLLEMEANTDVVCSVSCSNDGKYVAAGLSNGKISIYDSHRCSLIRSMSGENGRVTSLSWNGPILSSGSRSGVIINHDVSIANHHVATLAQHTQEVCGLRWSFDGRTLASGANDNLVLLWSAESTNAPVQTLSEHMAAVKALAWCPWQQSILASGGGSADRQIRFWNTNTGNCTLATDAGSQVSGLLWNSEYREIISGHGNPSHQLTIWKYPSMKKSAELSGHTSRVLNLTGSPCGEYVMSAGADESLRLWHCFKVDASQKNKTRAISSSRKQTSSIVSTIR